MPTYEIKAPDGRTYRIDGPDGATDAQVRAEVLRQHPNAGRAGQARAAPQPKQDTSIMNALIGGALKPLDNAATWLSNTAPGKALDRFGQSIGLPSTAQAVRGNEAARQRNTRTGYQLAGNIIGTAPLAALPGGVVVQGAAGGALLSDDPNNASGVAKDALIGAVTGKLGEKAVKGVARVVSPKVAPVVKRLQERGIPLTPGQIMGAKGNALGRAAKATEDKLTSVPGVGDAIVSARRRGVESFNRAAIDEVLAPIGGKLPKAIETGHASVGYAERALGKAYNAVLPNINAQADQQFASGMIKAASMADTMMEGRARQFEAIVKKEIGNAFDQTGAINGAGFKTLESNLGAKVRQFSASTDPDQRELGAALREVQSVVRDLAARQNPQHAGRLARINEGWAKLTRVQRAAALGLEGQFTPGQLRTATRVADTSVRKGASARGAALMQGFAEDAQSVLPSSIPDSGTAGRGMMGMAIGGVGGIPAMIGSGVASLPYTQAGGKAAEWLLTGRQGPVAQRIAETLRKLVPLGSAASTAGAAQLTAQ